ncbi:ATP-binding protein [Streptomyces sp. NPDC050610]|uniref:ATP-binding protein n=1 Tax=Streptomyces sp. NPDC050610 TaxID=3157097 RepID=UPI0034283966
MTVLEELEETAFAATPRREEGPPPYARSLETHEPPMAEATWPRSSREMILATEISPKLVRLYREACRRILAHWGLEAVADDVVLVVSELVTNAMAHGDVSLYMMYAADGTLYIVVCDGTPARPERLEPSLDDEHGRGLILVEELFDTWGTSADGKHTFATLQVSAAAESGDR